MKFGDRFKQWPFDKGRLEAFSDAVFSIVMTILVLDLKVPHIEHPDHASDVIDALISVKPVLLSWMVSFFFVALIWMHHSQILHMSTASDYGTTWINTFLLFTICLLPFPTSMMGQYPRSPFVVMIWGLTFSLTTAMLTWLYYYCAKHYLSDKYWKGKVLKNVKYSIIGGPIIYLIAALMAHYSVYISYFMYAFVPFLYILPLDKEKKKKNEPVQ